MEVLTSRFVVSLTVSHKKISTELLGTVREFFQLNKRREEKTSQKN
jgi:hypothetical protein